MKYIFGDSLHKTTQDKKEAEYWEGRGYYVQPTFMMNGTITGYYISVPVT